MKHFSTFLTLCLLTLSGGLYETIANHDSIWSIKRGVACALAWLAVLVFHHGHKK